MQSTRHSQLKPLLQVWPGGAPSCWLPVKDQTSGKRDQVTGAGPPVTTQRLVSPVTVTSHDSMTPANNKPTIRHRVRKGGSVAKLIGKRCMLTCYLNGVKTDMLPDSGAQVTILEKSWLEKNLPAVKIQSLENLLPDVPLRITAANGTDVPFEGWTELLVEIKSAKYGQVAIY